MPPTQQSDLDVRRDAQSPRRQQALGGLFVRRERWSLSVAGKLVVFLVFVLSGIFLMRGLYSFLAVTSPVSSKVLVVEGWMPTYMVEQVARQYQIGKYEKVLLVRPLLKGRNKYESGENVAHYLADTLVELGIPQDRVEIVFHEPSHKDRTYQSALAIKQWLQDHNDSAKAINVATLGPHARRSRLLFEKALEGKLTVGVIALNDQTYDGDHWWRSSEGVRDVPFEFVAYCYVRFLFIPSRHE